MTDFSRCRPLLGTYVSIRITGRITGPTAGASVAVERAFRKIEGISRSLSFHDPKSELSALNRTPVGEWRELSPDLAAILKTALRLQKLSQGWYNVAIGGPLVNSGHLPGKRTRVAWKDLRAISFDVRGLRARRRLPVLIDLGGIAKGYAVDQAVEILAEKFSGVVNAGGDLRVFGRDPQDVWIRRDERHVVPLSVRSRAVATSSLAGGRRKDSPYIDIRAARSLRTTRPRTAVVVARTCLMADALTKIALIAPARVTRAVAGRTGAQVGVLQ